MLRGSPFETVDDGAGASVPTVDLDVLVEVVGTSKPLGTHLMIITDQSVEHKGCEIELN